MDSSSFHHHREVVGEIEEIDESDEEAVDIDCKRLTWDIGEGGEQEPATDAREDHHTHERKVSSA